MSIDFKGRVAVVTGAGGGLGREYVRLLSGRGARLVVNDPGGTVHGRGDDRTVAQKLVDEIIASGGDAVANQDNVVDFDGAERIVRLAMERYGRLDILVNNAGILRDKTFTKMDLLDFRAVVDVHLFGTVNCTKAAWAIMNEQKYGRVVVTTSASGISGSYGQSNYGAAKMAVVGLMNCLAREGARNNVCINAISPAAATRMTESNVNAERGRYLRADLVSPAVAWLCSDQCTESGLIVSALAGYFARIQMFESQGVQFDPRQPVTPDMVAEAFDRFGGWHAASPVHREPLGDLDRRLRELGLLGGAE